MEAPHHHCRHQSIFQVSEEMFHQIAGVSGSFLSYRPSFIRYKSSGHGRSLCIKSKPKKPTRAKPVTLRIAPSKGVSCRTKTCQTLRRQEDPAGLPVPKWPGLLMPAGKAQIKYRPVLPGKSPSMTFSSPGLFLIDERFKRFLQFCVDGYFRITILQQTIQHKHKNI